MSEDMYILKWKSKLTDYEGQGTLSYPKKMCDQLVEDANKDFPNIEHWAELVKKENSS
jgi:hypothetical protein